MGSLAMTSFSTYLHLKHWNRRCSKPTGPGLMRTSIMRDVQCKQCGRSMDVSNGPPGKSVVGMMLPSGLWREHNTLSHRWKPKAGRRWKSFAQCPGQPLVKIAHVRKNSQGIVLVPTHSVPSLFSWPPAQLAPCRCAESKPCDRYPKRS